MATPWSGRKLIAAAATLAISFVCFAQEYRIVPGQTKQEAGKQLRKDVIQGHFLSKHPQPQWFPDKTVAGSRLLDQLSERRHQLQSRVRGTRMARLVSAGAEGAAYPGIQFRDAMPAGTIPTSVVTGDFNRDGHADFVVSNGYASDLWIYFGKGDGTFELPRIVPLSRGLTPGYLAAADLRGTGILDLVVAEFDTSTIGVLHGNGDGTFGFEDLYSLPQPPAALVVDDFNRDHKLDIVAVMFTVSTDTQQVDYIANLPGDGKGKFGGPIITQNGGFYGSAWNIASGDVNNDGLTDLVITGPELDSSEIYLNKGDGTFMAGQVLMESGPFNAVLDTRLGDLNEDGCLDAAVADADDLVWILYGDCAGNFTYSHYAQLGDNNSAIRLVDINLDGHLDLVTSALTAGDPIYGDIAGNTLSVGFGDGHGNFTLGRNYVGRGQSYGLAIADFNEDGKPDVVTPNADTDTATLYLNSGSGGFGFPEGAYVGLPGVGVLNAPVSPPYFADLNGDNKPDVLLLDEGYSGEYWSAVMLNDGTGRLSGPVITDTGINIIDDWMGDFKLGDFRNTGHLDMVGIGLSSAYSFSSSFIFFMPGNGDGTFGASTKVSVAGADGEMAIGDFNHDGKLDFVAVGPGTVGGSKQVLTFLGNGDGTFRSGAAVTFTDSASDIARVFVADFNRDGKLDVMVYDTANGYWTTSSFVWEFLGNGDGTFQTGQQLFQSFQPMTLADLNGDHWPDIVRYDFFWPDGVTEDWGPAKFTNYLGKPNGGFSRTSSYAPYNGVPKTFPPYLQLGDPTATSIVSDLNGDGISDEIAFQGVSPNNHAGYAQILMGAGDGTFTPTYDVFQFFKFYGHPKYAHDLDGDGKADLLELDISTSSMHVFKPAPAPSMQLELEDEQVTGNKSCGWIFPNVPSGSDRVVTLWSSVAGVNAPGPVTIPAGALSQRFCYSLNTNFDWHRVYDIRAQLGTEVVVAYASQAYNLGFSEALAPDAQQVIYPGQSTTPITVTLTSAQGYSSTAQLHCEGLASGSSCQFASSTLVIPPNGAASTTLVIQTTDEAQYGGTIFVVADDGNVAKRQPYTYVVQPLVVFESGNLRATPSGSIVANVFISGIPPYKPSCLGLPAGVTCSFSGDQLPWPSTTDLAMTITIPAGVTAASYPFTLRVTSGPERTDSDLTLDVIDFAFQNTLTPGWVLPGVSAYSTVYIDPLNNFNLFVNFTCSVDGGGSCTGSSYGIGNVEQTPIPLLLSMPAGTPVGSYTLSVTGTVGTLSHTAQFPFFVADYSGSLSGNSLKLTRGGSESLTATVNATDGFAGTVSLSCSGSSQVTCEFNPASLRPTATNPGTAKVTFVASPSASTRPPNGFGSLGLTLAVCLPFGLVIRKRVSTRGKYGPAAVVFLALMIATIFLSCGGGGGNSGGGGGGGGGGGSNSYTITVSATANGTTATRSLGVVNVTVTH